MGAITSFPFGKPVLSSSTTAEIASDSGTVRPIVGTSWRRSTASVMPAMHCGVGLPNTRWCRDGSRQPISLAGVGTMCSDTPPLFNIAAHWRSDATPNEATEHAPHGDVAAALESAAVRVECEYRMPIEHHNPMETFAATAVWEGEDQIAVFDKTQGALNSRNIDLF